MNRQSRADHYRTMECYRDTRGQSRIRLSDRFAIEREREWREFSTEREREKGDKGAKGAPPL